MEDWSEYTLLTKEQQMDESFELVQRVFEIINVVSSLTILTILYVFS